MAATTLVSDSKAHPIPPRELELRDRIHFHHPGYPAPGNIILSLPRVDTTPDPTIIGVHHRTALLACQVIANNAFDGRLALDQAGQQLVNVPMDDVLIEKAYYFINGNSLDSYPIVPSFRDWEFPHDCIPDSWPQSTSVSTSDHPRCGISNFSYSLEEAHLVPKEEVDWYNRNDMGRYGIGIGDIHNPANLLLLKSDIHKCFDNRCVVIAPKVLRAVSEAGSPRYMTHILLDDAAELWPTYHNTLVQYLHIRSAPYLFARFAWAVLLSVKRFITTNNPRYIIRLDASTDANGIQRVKYEKQLLNGQQLNNLYGGGGSKAATPMKRKSQGGSTVDDGGDDESSSECGIEDSEALWDIDMMDVWAERGIKRRQGRQESSDETVPDTKVCLASDVEADLREALRKGIPEQ